MRFDLAAMFRRARNPRRRVVTLRPIAIPATYATDLYQGSYAPVVAFWEAALGDILAEYERTLATMTTDAPADVTARIEGVERDAATVFVTLRARLERWAALLEQFQRKRWRGTVLTATGVDLKTMIGPADVRETVEAVIERNVSLVKSVSEEARKRIADSVFRGLRERKPAREVAKEIREAAAMGRRRALNIAGDQASKLGGALNDERRRQAGIDSWIWVHSGKLHPREDHKARNGNLYSESKGRVGEEYQGKRIRTPPADLPSQLPYCGCTARAVLILD